MKSVQLSSNTPMYIQDKSLNSTSLRSQHFPNRVKNASYNPSQAVKTLVEEAYKRDAQYIAELQFLQQLNQSEELNNVVSNIIKLHHRPEYLSTPEARKKWVSNHHKDTKLYEILTVI